MAQPELTADGVLSAKALDMLAQEHGLTRREREVVALVDASLSDVAIAERLCVSENTVGTHLFHVYRKLGVHGRREVVELMAAAKEHCR